MSGYELANHFNNYFVNLVSSEYNTNACRLISNNVMDTIFFEPTDEAEIFQIFIGPSNSRNCDIDNLLVEPCKFVIDIIKPCFTHINHRTLKANAVLLFTEAVFPSFLTIIAYLDPQTKISGFLLPTSTFEVIQYFVDFPVQHSRLISFFLSFWVPVNWISFYNWYCFALFRSLQKMGLFRSSQWIPA